MKGNSLSILPTISFFYIPLPPKKYITDKKTSPINDYRPPYFPEPSSLFRTPILCAKTSQIIAFQYKN